MAHRRSRLHSKTRQYEERPVGNLCKVHGVSVSTYGPKLSKEQVIEKLKAQPEFVHKFEAVATGAEAMLAKFEGEIPQPEHVGASSEVVVQVQKGKWLVFSSNTLLRILNARSRRSRMPR